MMSIVSLPVGVILIGTIILLFISIVPIEELVVLGFSMIISGILGIIIPFI